MIQYNAGASKRTNKIPLVVDLMIKNEAPVIDDSLRLWSQRE
jgi:hypothetical protein